MDYRDAVEVGKRQLFGGRIKLGTKRSTAAALAAAFSGGQLIDAATVNANVRRGHLMKPVKKVGRYGPPHFNKDGYVSIWIAVVPLSQIPDDYFEVAAVRNSALRVLVSKKQHIVLNLPRSRARIFMFRVSLRFGVE